MRYKQQLEDYLSKKVETMLLPVLGTGQVIVRVSAEIETESTTQTQERYDPEGQVARTESTTEDVSNTSEARSGGAAGISANVPGPGTSGQDQTSRPTNSTETNRKTHTKSYEINRTLTNTVRNPGTVRNITASVFIAQKMSEVPANAPAGTKPVPQPRSSDEIQSLRQIVMNALGLRLAPNQTPESLVSIKEMNFTVEPVSQQIATIQNETRIQSWMDTGSRYLAVGAAAGLFYLFLRLLKKQKPESVPVELLVDTPSHNPRAGYQLSAGSLTPEMLNDLIKQKPVNVGTALRDWASIKKVS
jgi:flagellar M-ring protein FliF